MTWLPGCVIARQFLIRYEHSDRTAIMETTKILIIDDEADFTALLRAKKAVGRLSNENSDVQAGINIVMKAIESPARQIAENSGVEGSIVVGKIMESKSETFGFDAQNEEYVDLVEKGIIDPAKVVRRALQDAASVAGLLVTTEAMVAEVPKDPGPAMPPGGGMGGMGGMM